MPRVLIGSQARAAAQDERQNEAFCWALKTVYARLGKNYTETADAAGTTRNQLYMLRNPAAVSSARFGTIRRVAHEIGMTKTEWLKLGGFE